MDPTEILYLSRADVERAAPAMCDFVDVVGRVLGEKGRGEVESPPKRGIVPRPDCSIRAMKAYVPSLNAAGVKWIGAYPGNIDRELPTITGLIILSDPWTGVPKAVMDCTWITALRTAACTTVTARHLARPDSATVGLVACGLQGRANLAALCAELPIERARAYDVIHANAVALAEEMEPRLGIPIEPVWEVEDAVRDMDVVVTSTPIRKDPEPPLAAGLLKPGALACLLDFDASFDGAAMREADRLVTDDMQQLNFFRRIGYFRSTPEPDVDLGKIVAGRVGGRRSDSERIMAMNMGISCLDIASAEIVYRRASVRGIGARLPLWAPTEAAVNH